MTEKIITKRQAANSYSLNIDFKLESEAKHGFNDDEISETLDARGLACPLPLLKAKLILNRLDDGELLKVLATDGGSERDFPVFAKLSGNQLVVARKENDVYVFVIKKVEAQFK